MTLTKRILSFLTAVIMLLSINVPFTMTASAASVLEEATELSDVSTQSWMSAIRGETRLSEITMPGTHDTGARDFEGGYALLSSISKCQGLTIPEQLDAGARFLDIRVEAHGESDDYYAFLTHGETTVRTPGTGAWGSISGSDKYYLDRLFKECYDFLDRHPSETILMCLKKDKGDQDIATSVYQYIHGVSKVNGNQYFNDIYPEGYNWQDHWYVAGDDPTLDDVRGKIVVFNRYNFDYDLDETTGGVQAGVKIDWNDQEDPSSWIDPCYELNKQGNGYIQDRYSWQKNDKLSATQQMLDLTHTKGMWYISFSSTTWGTLIPNPEGHANEINPGLPYLNFTPGKPSGIYLMDFLGASDSAEYSNAFDRKLIENNRAVSNLVTGTDGNIRYELNRLTKTLTISGNGAMSNYGIISGVGVNNTGTNAPWGDQIYNSLFDGQYNTDIIENIVIEDGVTAIGNYAFYGFDHIKNVSFPASLTTIGNNAFEGCSGLTSFDIRDDSITTIGNEAFKNCTGITSFYTSDTVTAIGTDAFAGHSSSLIMYGPWECYSRDYADANNITYYGPYAVYSSSLNTVYENKNPFAGQDLSNGVKISFKQYCETDKGWDGAMLSFSSGKRNENRYFIIMANGAILFNDGSDGSGGTQCYFDINSNSTVNPIGDQWVDIDVTVSSAHILKYYVNGEKKAEYDLNAIAASGYPANGTSAGTNGIFSFLSSNDINLYYGGSFAKYSNFAGTADSYLDDVALYTAENAADPVFTNSFDNSIPTAHSGDTCWVIGYKERAGVLYIPASTVTDDHRLYYNGTAIDSGTQEYMYSTINAVYLGVKPQIRWDTAVKTESGYTVNQYTGSNINFSLVGDTFVYPVYTNIADQYVALDFSSFDSAYTAAVTALGSSDYTTDSLADLQEVVDGLTCKPATGTTHDVTYYGTYQATINSETAALNTALSHLESTTNFGALDQAYHNGEALLESLDGTASKYPEELVRALRTALTNAQVYEALTAEQRQNFGSGTAQAEVDAKTDAINSAIEALNNASESEIGEGLDLTTYQSAIKVAETLDPDVYDYDDGEMDFILTIISMSLSGDTVTYKKLTGEVITVNTVDTTHLTQPDVDGAVELLLSSLTDHIRMYDVKLAEGNAAVGFNGNGKSKGPDSEGVYKTTYNSTAVFTADEAETAWYMEYTSKTTTRDKQYQTFGNYFALQVLGDINVYAVSRTDSNFKVTLMRDYDNNSNHPTYLVDFVDNGAKFTLPVPAPLPYYTFDGYYIGFDKIGDPGDEIEISEDTIIHAHYNHTDENLCDVVIYDTNGNELVNESINYNRLLTASDANAYAWVEENGGETRPFCFGTEVYYYVPESTTIRAVTKETFDSYGFKLPLVNIPVSDPIVLSNNGTLRTTFNGQLVNDGANITLEYGYLIGKATTGTINSSDVTIENSGTQNGYAILRAKATKDLKGANQFTINVNGLTGGIYYRGYVIYQTPSGEIKTRYTDVRYVSVG